MSEVNRQSPIVIGGLGGSGTRTVSMILSEAGFYMGKDQNSAGDNLWFTMLFKRRKWYLQQNETDINFYLDIFTKAMLGELKLTIKEQKYIFKAFLDIFFSGHDYKRSGRGLWAVKRLYSLYHSDIINLSAYRGWGWKEPNTHIFLKYLNNYYPEMKYIHVIRNGLDMAFSSNLSQLYNWGSFFGITNLNRQNITRCAFEYWLRANEQAISTGQTYFGKRFLLLYFEKLCNAPALEMKRIFDFLQLPLTEDLMQKLCQIIQKPDSVERYRNFDLSVFSEEQIRSLKSFGYKI